MKGRKEEKDFCCFSEHLCLVHVSHLISCLTWNCIVLKKNKNWLQRAILTDLISLTLTNLIKLSLSQAFPSVTAQPLPFGLERERHIDMLFRAFHRRIGPATDSQDLTAELGSTDRRGEDEGPGGKKLGKLSVLRTVTRLHINARPELQGEY